MLVRDYFPGVGQAVADRTVNRPGEKWGDVAKRVSIGNTSLVPFCQDQEALEAGIASGQMLLSGRHLQHGDADQPNRPMEVFTNCSTAAQRAIGFYLMLNGSGVGSCYDDDMCIVDWSRMPKVHIVLAEDHADYDPRWVPTVKDAVDQIDSRRGYRVFEVPDSREGWGEAVMQIEDAAWRSDASDLILVFSKVRPKGSPIGGMQNRPSSGPVPLMEAIVRVQETLRGQRLPLWEQAMTADHFFAEIVLVGGARRAARIACKWWGDGDIISFINIKQTGGHWTANNSVGVDAVFWSMVRFYKKYNHAPTARHQKAWDVFCAVTEAQYQHGTGEPAFLNMDLLSKGETAPTADEALHLNGRLTLTDCSLDLRRALMVQASKKKYPVIVNPCGEIRLSVNGGYCVEASTRILHRTGYDRIVDLVGREIEVFNGEEWSAVTPFKTGENETLLRVSFSDGSYLECTPQHRFSVRDRRQGDSWREVAASDLKVGAILPTFRSPSDFTGEALENAYTYGAFLGDGNIEHRSANCKRFEVVLYEGKHHLPVVGTPQKQGLNGGIAYSLGQTLNHDKMVDLKSLDGLPDWVFNLDQDSSFEFVKGWLDTDGLLHKDTKGISISMSSPGRARDLQLLLRRMGFSYVSRREASPKGFVTNYGPRSEALWQVYIPKSEAGLLQGHRVLSEAPVELEKLVKQPRVLSVEVLQGQHETFCFTEPKRGMGVFGNVLTYQCVIGDIAVAFCNDQEEFNHVARLMTRALIRTNMMPALYQGEVSRTNRIGVAMTGMHEYAWQRFGLNFYDLLDEDPTEVIIDANGNEMASPSALAMPFWMSLFEAANVVQLEMETYSDVMGVACPTTGRTIKPAGTTSKLFGLTEGAHLASMGVYLRWVQFRDDDPLIAEYEAKGYPVRRDLKSYKNVVIIGFPTCLPIADMMGDKLVTAAQATPSQQIRWIRLLETFWLLENGGNQVSYTLKYDPAVVDEEEYKQFILDQVSLVRAVSVMPQIDQTAYEYQPEQPITRLEYDQLVANIEIASREDIGQEHVECASGACPISFDSRPLSKVRSDGAMA
jgi:hypothetical protein